jgi:hypothetical protein
VKKFMHLGGHADCLYILLYVAWCDFMMDLTASVPQSLCKSRVMETLTIIKQEFGEESMSHTWVLNGKVPTH